MIFIYVPCELLALLCLSWIKEKREELDILGVFFHCLTTSLGGLTFTSAY
jgi:hypothetical protein